MSKNETWRTRKYWEKVGGLLIEEYKAIRRDKNQGQRLLDAVIVLNEDNRIHHENYYDVEGKDIIVIQTKATRLGMYLLGQAYFSKLLMERFNPKSIRSVAICGKGDIIMEQFAKNHDIEVVVLD
ncbi:hypothetical protein [Algoriphagus limi]|uniref:Uncharacterized protein n=1 Tax=Algoriphagus limi TaxID=2975273 RepID=A0ABT2G2A3_9BACT|nr:hypothetical protein [Algoriphagus limi]MCS5489299.1 hypothetical protein [Algoriphagus limi]